MTLEEAEALFKEHCSHHYTTRNVMFIGKPGTSELRPINLDEATPKRIIDYAKYLQSLET